MTKHLLYNNHLIVMAVVLIAVGGISALIALPRLEDPRITNRNPIVLMPFPGASSQRVETLVTEPIEDALQEVPEIKNFTSTSRTGISVITIELEDTVTRGENEAIFSKIRDRLSDAARNLPPGAAEPFLDDQRGATAYTHITALRWEMEEDPPLGLLARLADDLASHLRTVPGTELVRLFGVPEEEITVSLDRDALARLGMSPGQVAARLAGADTERPAGVLRTPRNDVLAEVRGGFEVLDRVRAVPLRANEKGGVLRLGDLATVDKGWRNPPEEIALVDGERTIFVAARMDPEVRIDVWANEVKQLLAESDARLDGVAYHTVFDQSAYTNERLRSLAANLAMGAGVVMLVIFLTMGWRAALIVGAALPLTAAMVLFTMSFSGFALHQMSIFGMIIALGLLIDNAIVVVDEVRKRRKAGEAPAAAVAECVRYLAVPLGASTATTVLAFAPIVLLPGNAGDFVGSIGRNVILAVVFSLLLSLTLIAALAGRALNPQKEGQRVSWLREGMQSPPLKRGLNNALGWFLRRPALGILVACIPPLIGFALAPTLGNQFFPPVDRNMFEMDLWLPNTASIEHTRDAAAEVEAFLKESDRVRHVNWLIGGSFPSVYYNVTMSNDRAAYYGHAIIEVETAADTKALIPELQEFLNQRLPEAQAVARQFGQGPPVNADVEYRLFGPNIQTLQQLGEPYRRALQHHPGILHTRPSIPEGEPKLWLYADETAAEQAGLTLAGLATQLRAGMQGVPGGTLLEDLENLPVSVRWPESAYSVLATTASANFTAGIPESWTPLTALGEWKLEPERASITRYNGVRSNIIAGYARNDALPINIAYDVLDTLEAEGFELPPGYRLEFGGAVETDSDAVANLSIYLPLIVTLTLTILILVFRSVRAAGMLLAVGLLSAGLGLLATWTINFPISFNTILGTLGLIGVSLNDSIVVLASIRSEAAARAGDPSAVAHRTLDTLRHVISTTLTTSGGFLPLLLFVGGDFWPSLAIVLAGGVLGASLLALLFVPSAYVLLFRPRHQQKAAAS